MRAVRQGTGNGDAMSRQTTPGVLLAWIKTMGEETMLMLAMVIMTQVELISRGKIGTEPTGGKIGSMSLHMSIDTKPIALIRTARTGFAPRTRMTTLRLRDMRTILVPTGLKVQVPEATPGTAMPIGMLGRWK